MVPPTVAWVGTFLGGRVAPAQWRIPVLTPVGRGMRGRAGTARGGTANRGTAPPTVWVSPIGRLLQAGTAPHARVASADQPRSHPARHPPRQLSDRKRRTASSPQRYRSAPEEGLFANSTLRDNPCAV